MSAAAERWSGPVRVLLEDRPLVGALWAATTVLIWAGYPAVTRLSVTSSLRPEDLFALRFGISALLFAPYVLRQAAGLPSDIWTKGIGLAVCQGGLAALIIVGLQLAPANHASTLVQGVIPAWMLVLGAVLYGQQVRGPGASGVLLIAFGVVFIVADGNVDLSGPSVVGDLLFLLASLLAAGYILQMRRFAIPATAGAALVAIYSAIVFLPWYFLAGDSRLADVPWAELALQIAYQGILVGYVSFIALNRAIAALGGTRTGALISLVPALTALIAIPVLGERPSILDCSAIALVTVGVVFVARARRRHAPALRRRSDLPAPPIDDQMAASRSGR